MLNVLGFPRLFLAFIAFAGLDYHILRDWGCFCSFICFRILLFIIAFRKSHTSVTELLILSEIVVAGLGRIIVFIVMLLLRV